MPGVVVDPPPAGIDKTQPAAETMAYINGRRHVLPLGKAEMTLLSFLRGLELTGTKLGCGEGGCGACTVMVSAFQDGRIQHRAVNACLAPLYSVEGCHVVTVEGIGNPRDGLHPIQERLAKLHGSQCGFCTPGFVMSMYSLLRAHGQEGKPITEEDIETALGGNLCRCTGYRPILDAFRVFSKADETAYTQDSIAACQQANGNGFAATNDCGQANGCANGHCANGCASGTSAAANGDPMAAKRVRLCPSTGQPCDCGPSGPSDVVKPAPGSMRGPKLGMAKGEPIFPGELVKREPQELVIPGKVATWMRPVTMESLLAMKAAHPGAKLVAGNTEVGIEVKFKGAAYPVLIAPSHVAPLTSVSVEAGGVRFGAAVTIARLLETCKELVATRPSHETAGCKAIADQLLWFAGVQIRNTASIGGNIATGSPISDLNPLWMAAGATFVVEGQHSGERCIPAADFFLGYRKVDLQPHEVLKSVWLPFTRRYEYVKEYKQAHRKEDDIAIVTAGMRIRMEPSAEGWKVAEAHFAYGGVAPKTVMARSAASALVGRRLDEGALEAATEAVLAEVRLEPGAPGGMVEFRRSLAASFLFKMLVHTSLQLQQQAADTEAYVSPFPADFHSAAAEYHRPASRGVQVFSAKHGDAIVGAPRRHLAADLQVCGEAKYQDDAVLPANALHGVMLTSARPHARLLRIDASKALERDGVRGFFTAQHVPNNQWGPVFQDEVVFAEEEVIYVGQPIGVVVATSPDAARAAIRQIVVEYEDLPAIVSIDEALEANSFYQDGGTHMTCGDVDAIFGGANCAHVLEGEVRLGGQEHFYLETNGSYVAPTEEDELLMVSSTQNPSKHQQVVAKALGIRAHKVVCKTKRLGGGFGGKETRAIIANLAAAVGAYHTGKPVSVVMDRDEDMQITGQRHAYVTKYKVGFSAEGKLLALRADMYSNVGHSMDLSCFVMECSMVRFDNSYRIPAADLRGHLCKTNQASNTAFRGFGGPQAITTMEMIMERIAATVGRPAEAVRQLNFYVEGDTTHYGQPMVNNNIAACWDACLAQGGGLQTRRAAVDAFNAANRFRKRGLAATPTLFGIAFTEIFLNQAGALVHLYTDGTALVTHGGVEMGQGLHTKCAQIAAHELGIPLSSVFIAEASTDKVPNTVPTAGSMSSDLNGMAVQNACRQLAERLAPYRKAQPDTPMADIASAAWFDRVDLCAHGFHKVPDVNGYGNDHPFSYFSFGSSLSEVELDTLTGDFSIVRTDIVMDVGDPINPAIDVGQIEGGFVQGVGWLCLEELVWGDAGHPWVPRGHLATKGPGAYKIPSVNNIPLDMRVSLLHDAPNPRAVHSSKAIGEPPFHLATSVFFALKDAIYAARRAAGLEGWFPLHAPATPERLRMACTDFVTASTLPCADFQPYTSC